MSKIYIKLTLLLGCIALLAACGSQVGDTTGTTAKTSGLSNLSNLSSAASNASDSKLLASLAATYPNGQLPAALKAQADIALAQNPAALKMVASSALVANVKAGFGNINNIKAQAIVADTGSYSPVYRIQNNDLPGAYFFTIFDSERYAALSQNPSWKLEGVAFYTAITPAEGLSPVYRFRNKTNGSYVYTIFEEEYQSLLANYSATFVLEGVSWYARQSAAAGYTPLYRFRNKTNGAYLFSAYESEKNAIVANYAAVFELEGIAFYVRLESDKPAPKVTVLSTALSAPWGMAFLPDGRMLVTQKGGTFVIISANGATVSAPFSPTLPNLVSAGQGGLLDVVLDPDFNLASNPRIYWTFSESGAGGSGTAVATGNLVGVGNGSGFAIQNASVIYRQVPKVVSDGHFGSRLAFRSDKTLFVTLGDRALDDPGNPSTAHAQNLAKTLGKVVRINRNGTVPAGNPNFGVAGTLPEIWSMGHRNPQGAAIKPGTDDLWLTEHGPLGGDELNRVLPGRNYGWPLRSYGCPYSSGSNTPACWVNGGTHAPTFEEPKATWLPSSTAPSAMIFYTGSQFNDLGWQGNVFTGGLAGSTLWRVVLSGDDVVSKEEVTAVKTLGQRIRAVKQGPDGWIYLLTDGGQLLRLER